MNKVHTSITCLLVIVCIWDFKNLFRVTSAMLIANFWNRLIQVIFKELYRRSDTRSFIIKTSINSCLFAIFYEMYSSAFVQYLTASMYFCSPLLALLETVQLVNLMFIVSKYLKSKIDFQAKYVVLQPASLIIISISLFALASVTEDVFEYEKFEYTSGACWGIFNPMYWSKNISKVELLSEPWVVLVISLLCWAICLLYTIISDGADANIMNGALFCIYLMYFTKIFGNSKLDKYSTVILPKVEQSTDLMTMLMFSQTQYLSRVINFIAKWNRYVTDKIGNLTSLNKSMVINKSTFSFLAIFTIPLTSKKEFIYKESNNLEVRNHDIDQSDDGDEGGNIITYNLMTSLLILTVTAYWVNLSESNLPKYFSYFLEHNVRIVAGTLYFIYKVRISE